MSGDGEEAATTEPPAATTEARPVAQGIEHIHALAVNPADGVLVVATHRGVYRLVDPGPRLDRLSADPFDAIGFAVAAPNLFFSSGHPPEGRNDLPQDLGLLHTTDGGRSWEGLSLNGAATFQVIRAVGTTVYGYDAASQLLLLSRDGGVTWSARPTPVVFGDLVFDPADSDSLLATAANGLYRSPDTGDTWRRVGSVRGYLTWPDVERLYVLATNGILRRSGDGGATFRRIGDVGGVPTALATGGERELFAAVEGPAIMHSSDGGATWSELWRSGTIG
jgi:photosystem II stability/assembly factor-like uncharacterized protein